MPDDVRQLLARLEAAGYPAYLVGGSLRDTLRGLRPDDWDIASAATPAELAELFTDARLLAVGARFGTVILLTDSRPIEITTFRSEAGYSDGRHPDQVSYSRDVLADLARRDFTVNAMAFSPERGLLDPYGGQIDLRAGLLRTVGQPAQRLAEDGLRIMRALRLAATQGFSILPELVAALHAGRELLRQISPERLQKELMQMLAGEHLLGVLLEYPDVLAVFIPEISATIGFDQKSPWHSYTVWEHTARAVVAVQPDQLIRLTLLLHDLGKPGTYTTDVNDRGHFYGHAQLGASLAEQRLQALHFDKQTISIVTELIRHHLDGLRPEYMIRALRRLGEEQCRRLIAVKRGDLEAHRLETVSERNEHLDACLQALEQCLSAAACFSLAQLAVNGDDLLAHGWQAGPALGQALEQLLSLVVNEGLENERLVLLKQAQSILKA